MEIIKNDGKRCILWLSCDCCDDGDTVVIPDTGSFKIVEEPELQAAFYLNDTAKPSFKVHMFTELVFIGGVQQTRNKDYTIDYQTNLISIIHGNEPKVPYETLVISYITGDTDMDAYVEADPLLSQTLAPNDTITLEFVPAELSEEVFIGGVQQTRNKDYSIDYPAKKITIFAGNEPRIPYESVTVSYTKKV